jgi:hypothetical protein
MQATCDLDDPRHDASALGHLAPAAVGVLIGNPDLRQKAGGMQPCQGPASTLSVLTYALAIA